MVDTTDNNKYVYPLTAQSRGKFVIADTDPNNTPLNLIKLQALYGLGNVVVVPQAEYFKYIGSNLDLMSLYSSEGFDPLSIATSSSNTVAPIKQSSSITLIPPTNLTIGKPITVPGQNGTNTVSVPVFFDPVAGVDGYEITYSSTSTAQSLQVTGVVTSSSTSGHIVVSWNTIANATNYTFTATNMSNQQQTSVLVTPDQNAVTLTQSMSVPSGTYQVSITPYNSSGLAGITYITGNIAV